MHQIVQERADGPVQMRFLPAVVAMRSNQLRAAIEALAFVEMAFFGIRAGRTAAPARRIDLALCRAAMGAPPIPSEISLTKTPSLASVQVYTRWRGFVKGLPQCK